MHSEEVSHASNLRTSLRLANGLRRHPLDTHKRARSRRPNALARCQELSVDQRTKKSAPKAHDDGVDSGRLYLDKAIDDIW